MENCFQDLITGMQHIGIPTNNMEGTIAFYEMFGFRTAFETENEKTKGKVAFLKLGDIIIEAYESEQVAGKSGALDHIALNVTDIEKVFCLAKENKCHMLDDEIQFLPFWSKGVRFFTITGPNQEKVEFSQYL